MVKRPWLALLWSSVREGKLATEWVYMQTCSCYEICLSGMQEIVGLVVRAGKYQSESSSSFFSLYTCTFRRKCKHDSIHVLCKPSDTFKLRWQFFLPFKCSTLALFTISYLEPMQIRSIVPSLPLLSLTITRRKDGDLALSASFVSPKKGNRQMSFTLQQILSRCFQGWCWHGDRLPMSEHTISTSPHWCYPTCTVNKVVSKHFDAHTQKNMEKNMSEQEMHYGSCS